MAAWDNVILPTGPRPTSYAAPLVDFSGIGDLYGTYAKGQMMNNQLAQSRPVSSNNPQAIMQELMQRPGGGSLAEKLIPLMQRQQFLNQYNNEPGPSEEGDAGAAPQEAPQARAQPSYSFPEHGVPVPVQQATEGMISAVPDTGPNAGRNIAPEVNAAGVAARPPVQTAQAPQQAPSTLPSGVSETAAKNMDKRIRFLTDRAGRAEIAIGKGAGAGDLAEAKILADRAAKIREQLSEGPKQLQSAEIKRSEAKYTGMDAAASQWERGGRELSQLSKGILNNPEMYSGIGANRVLDWNKITQAFGGNPNFATLQEALTKVTAQQTLGTINQQKDQVMEAGSNSARIFTAQVDLARKAAAGLENTLAGNRLLTEAQTRAGERFVQIRNMAADYMDTHGGVLGRGWDRYLSNWLESDKGQMWTARERANPAIIGAPEVPDDIAARGQGDVLKWAASMGASIFRTHEGNRYIDLSKRKAAPPGAAVAAPRQL